MAEPTKQCRCCGQVKPLSEFYRHRGHKDGRDTQCKPCKNKKQAEWVDANREKVRQAKHDRYIRTKPEHQKRTRAWYLRNKDKAKQSTTKHRLRTLYGLSIEDHERMYAQQNGRCKLCDELTEYRKCHIDHNHETGEVRGLLCARCNLIVGMVETNTVAVRRAFSYAGVPYE